MRCGIVVVYWDDANGSQDFLELLFFGFISSCQRGSVHFPA